jgi:acylphosphatase
MFEEIRCIVEGRVQMVMYRDFAQRKARGLDIVGWVRNLENGTVEVVAQSTPDNLKLFIEKLHEGSILSRVDSVSVEWRAPSGHFDDFTIKYV